MIKFAEGYIAGYLVKRFRKIYRPFYSMLAGGSLTAGLLLFGIFFYSGEVYVGPGE